LICFFQEPELELGIWQTTGASQLELATVRSPVQTKLKTGSEFFLKLKN
jgi:hypothetical protein